MSRKRATPDAGSRLRRRIVVWQLDENAQHRPAEYRRHEFFFKYIS